MNPRLAMLEAWLEGRPEIIKQLARKYPPGTRFNMHGKVMHVISFEESGGLAVTEIDPRVDYKKAVEMRQPVCACCTDKLDELRIE